MFIQTETTSHDHVLRFLPGRSVVDGETVTFGDEAAAQRSPLAARLFQIEAVTKVALDSESVTVSKTLETDWQLLKPAIFGIIMEHFLANKPVLLDGGDALAAELRTLLDERVRPDIAEEGGDILFHDLRDGVATLELVDNGLTMPAFSLQIRVENTIRHYLPEVTAVEFTRPAPPESVSHHGLDLDDPETAAVKALLDDRINPSVAAHGGYIALIAVEDHVVHLSLEGGCQGCGMADVTLKQGVEAAIHDEVPTITAVYDATDHAGGTNPYYEPDKAGISPF
ncbi:MAG: NifU family protein [Pseudomonadota bacterium]|nr:NifU family protein [Pseudomonadota bacterium]